MPCVFVSHNVTMVKYVQQYHQSVSQNTYWYVPSYFVSFLQIISHAGFFACSFLGIFKIPQFQETYYYKKNATILFIYLQYQYITIVYIYFYQTTGTIIHFITIKPLSSIQF